MSEKKRLDQLLVDRGLAPSREKAKALIMAGQVYVQNQNRINRAPLTRKLLRLRSEALD